MPSWKYKSPRTSLLGLEKSSTGVGITFSQESNIVNANMQSNAALRKWGVANMLYKFLFFLQCVYLKTHANK